jgi:hypothetical protein
VGTKFFFQLFFLLISITAFAHEGCMKSRSQPEKIYVQPEQIAFFEQQIWVNLGPENWIPVEGVASDSTGFYALSYESDPDDVVPGTKKCWNCGATNSLRATTCWKCSAKI